MRFHITPDFSIQTDLLDLRLQVVEGIKTAHATTKEGKISITIPSDLMSDKPQSQEWLNRIIVEVLRQQCHRILTPCLLRLAQTAGLSFNRITYKDVSSRWGSCSSLRNLNFSVWILLAPSLLVEYLLAHELAHLTELNHSAKFWKEVDRILGNTGAGKQLDAQLNAFAKTLHPIRIQRRI